MARCKACGAEIFWIRTVAGKSIPVDEKPVSYYEGDTDRIVTEDGEVYRCSLEGDSDSFIGFGYVSHFATCPQAHKFRRKRNAKKNNR